MENLRGRESIFVKMREVHIEVYSSQDSIMDMAYRRMTVIYMMDLGYQT